MTLQVHMILIGKELILSPPFPPVHTVHAIFTAHGVPSDLITIQSLSFTVI